MRAARAASEIQTWELQVRVGPFITDYAGSELS